MFFDRPAHPLLVPPDFIHAIVVAAAVGHTRLVEFRMREQTAEGVLSPRAGAVNTDARDIHFGMLCRGRFDPQDAIREPSVTDVLPANIVELFGAMARAHAIHLHDDETQFRQILHAWHRVEGLWGEGALRPRINIF